MWRNWNPYIGAGSEKQLCCYENNVAHNQEVKHRGAEGLVFTFLLKYLRKLKNAKGLYIQKTVYRKDCTRIFKEILIAKNQISELIFPDHQVKKNSMTIL